MGDDDVILSSDNSTIGIHEQYHVSCIEKYYLI
jgi:hypothetical protein